MTNCKTCGEPDGIHADDCGVRMAREAFRDRRPNSIHFQGAGPLQAPSIIAAKEEWLYVYASDRNRDAPGLKLAHEVLPTHDSVHPKFCNWAPDAMSKLEMRKKLRGMAQIPQPAFMGGDLIVKPEMGSGSVGVQSFSGVLVEQKVTGRHIDVNGCFLGGQFYPCGMMEHFPNEHHVPMRGNEIPGDSIWFEILERAAYACGYTDGPVKGDFIETFLIEISPRFHGDISTSCMMPFGGGINGPRLWFIYLATGQIASRLCSATGERVGAWRVVPPGVTPKEHERVTAVYLRDLPEYHEEDTTGIRGYVSAWGETADLAYEVLNEVCGEE